MKKIIIYIILILTTIIIYLYRRNNLNSVLNVDNIEAKLIDKTSDGLFCKIETYKLSDETINKFIRKNDKSIKNKVGYIKKDWSIGNVDYNDREIIDYLHIDPNDSKTRSAVDKILSLYESKKNYYAFYYKESNNNYEPILKVIFFVLSENDNILYKFTRYNL